MAKRLTNSEKNRRARDKWNEQLAKSNASDRDAIAKSAAGQRDWSKRPSPGPVITMRGGQPVEVFTPSGSKGGGTFATPAGQKQTKDRDETRKVARALRNVSVTDQYASTFDESGGSGKVSSPSGGSGIDNLRKLGEGIGDIGELAGDQFSEGDIMGGAGTVGRAALSLAGGGWALEDMGESETPQNVGQWLLNLLSTGTYAGARAIEGIGAAVDATQKRGGKDDYAGQGIAESVVNAGGGLVRGVGEGLGMRFDGQRPRTHGQNLEAVGTKDALVGALGEDAGNFTQGLIGTVADVALDPLSYVTLGASGAIGGAAKGLRAGAAAGKTTAGKAVKGTVGAVAGAGAGMAARRSELIANRATAKTNAALIKQAKRNPELVQTMDDLASPQVADEIIPEQLADEAPVAATPTDVQGGGPAPAALAPTEIDPRVASIEELVPNLRGTEMLPTPQAAAVSVMRELDKAAPAPVVDPKRLPLQAEARRVTAIVDGSPNQMGLMSRVSDAIKASPELEAFVRQTVPIGGKKTPILEVARQSLVHRTAGGAPEADPWRAVEQAYGLDGGGGPVDLTRELLDSALATADDRIVATDPAELFQALLAAPTRSEKLNVLQTQTSLRSVDTKTYDDFAVALDDAAGGNISPAMMRMMADALGIQTKATSQKTLQKLLSTQGRLNWAEIEASMPTRDEVLQAHDVTPEMSNLADEVDLAEEAADYSAAASEAVSRPALTAEQVGPKGQSSSVTGTAVFEMSQAAGKYLRAAGARATVDSYGDQMATVVQKAMMTSLRNKVRRLSGAQRGDVLYAPMLQALDVFENGMRARGVIPRLQGAPGNPPMYISVGDIMRELPEDVVKRAFLSPEWGRATLDREVADSFRAGFTAYPNDVAAIIHQARELANAGLDPRSQVPALADDLVRRAKDTRQAVSKAEKAAGRSPLGSKSFLESTAGKAAARDLARAVVDPAFLARIEAIHLRTKPVAIAFSKAAAEEIIQPLGTRILTLLSRGGADRGEIMQALEESLAEAKRLAKPADGIESLADDLVQQRMTQAITNGILNENGTLIARADARASKAGATVKGRTTAERAQGVRSEQARAGVATMSDAERPIDEALAELVDEGYIPDEELAIDLNRADLMQGNISDRPFQKLAIGMSGRQGQKDLHILRVAAEDSSFNMSGQYAEAMRKWVTGLVRQTGGLEAAQANLKLEWRALAAVDESVWREGGDALRADLALGGKGFDALDEMQVEQALELRDFINAVFEPSRNGMLSRISVSAADMRSQMDFRFPEEFKDFKADVDGSLADQAGAWRTFDTVDSPLDLLSAWHQAAMAASVPPSIGANLSKMFDHRIAGMTSQEAYAAGWRRMDATKSKGIGQFVDPTSYFPPEIISQMGYVNTYLEATKTFGKLQPMVRVYDSIMHVLKSSATVWRPGHHVTNILGEMGMNLMAGVNPARAGKALKTIRAGGQLLDADFGPLTRYYATEGSITGKDLAKSMSDDVAHVVIGGKVTEVPLEEIWRRAVNDGSALTHTAARDLQLDVAERVGTTPLQRLDQNANVLRMGDEALGRLSAIRDNVTRITHYIDELEKRGGRTLDEAFTNAARVVHDYHPTMRDLAAGEQKYARRLVFFYSWVRQAISRVIRTGLDHPGFVTMPSKAVYNQAEANELEPESIGKPISGLAALPSYHEEGLLGPTYQSQTANPEDPEGAMDLWGFSLSSPQLDTLQTLFAGATGTGLNDPYEDGKAVAGGVWKNLRSQLAPIPRMLAAYDTLDPYGTKKPEQVAFDQLGAVTGLSRLIPGEDGGSLYNDMFPKKADEELTPEEKQEVQRRYLLNFLTGVKSTNYTDPTSERVANQEMLERTSAIFKREGITDDDEKDAIRQMIRDHYASKSGVPAEGDEDLDEILRTLAG